MNTMKALVVDELNHVSLVDWREPEPGPGDVVMKVHYSGVSAGTERLLGTGALRDYGDPPFVTGYQATGEIVKLGADVKDLEMGEMVVAFFPSSHSALMRAPRSAVHRIPDAAMADMASLFVQPSVGANSLNEAMVATGDSVLIIGQGLVGQMTAQLARLRGAHVVASDVSRERIAMSERYCADWVVDASAGPVSRQAASRFPEGFDVVIESSGVTAVLDDAIAAVKYRGRLVFEGYHPGNVQFIFHQAHRKEIKAVFPCAIGPQQVADGVLRLMHSGALQVRPLISHRVPWRSAVDEYMLLFTPERDRINAMVIDWSR